MINDFLKLAREEGVSHEDNFPFWFEPESGATACVVLIHGFSATPREMRPLAAALLEKGFATLGVRLPGHGTSPEDLSRRHFSEWIATVSAAIRLASQSTPRVYAAGLSTGALALLAASREHALGGMVLLAPFLRLHHPLAPYVWLLRHVFHYEKREIESELQPFYYARRPLRAIHQLMLLIREVRAQLSAVTAPMLVFASEGDTTADHDSAIELFERLGSEPKEMVLYGDEVPHAMMGEDNPRRPEIIRRTVDFFLGLELGGGPAEKEQAQAGSPSTSL